MPLAPIICYYSPQKHSERRFPLKEELLINSALNEFKSIIKSEIIVIKIEFLQFLTLIPLVGFKIIKNYDLAHSSYSCCSPIFAE